MTELRNIKKALFNTGAKILVLTFMLALAGGFFGNTVEADAAGLELDASCIEMKEAEEQQARCDFRFTEAQTLEVLSLSSDGQRLDGSIFTNYAGSDLSSAWLFLIDRSNPRRARTVQRNVELVKAQMEKMNERRLMGVATFASDLDIILKPQASYPSLDAKLGAIVADGVATEFYANAIEGVKILSEVKAQRKALVILSDGKAEDTAYSANDVIELAREQKIAIFGLGFAEKATDTPSLQGMRRLAEETGGHYAAVVGSEEFSASFLKGFTNYLENGGTVRAPISGSGEEQNIVLEVSLADGRTFSHSEKIAFASAERPDDDPEPKALSLIGQIYSIFGSGEGSLSEWAENNQAIAWLIPLLLIGAAVLLAVLRSQKQPPTEDLTVSETDMIAVGDDETELPEGIEGATRAMSGGSLSAVGYFEVVGNEEMRYEIHGQSATIGRHSDNDICLANDSVHRHHAHFHISPSGEATLADLETANGIFVNGSRISKSGLQSGDLVELGEVRLRFFKTEG